MESKVLSFFWKSDIEDIKSEIERLKDAESENYEKIVSDVKEMGETIGASVEALVTGFSESSKSSQQVKSHVLHNSRSIDLLSDRIKRLEVKDDKALKERILKPGSESDADVETKENVQRVLVERYAVCCFSLY